MNEPPPYGGILIKQSFDDIISAENGRNFHDKDTKKYNIYKN